MDIMKLIDKIESNEETHNAVKAYIRDLMSEIDWDIHIENMDRNEKYEQECADYYRKLKEHYEYE